MEDLNIKKVPENENLKKVVKIVEKILVCNEQKKGRGLKRLIPKQMLQRLLKTY